MSEDRKNMEFEFKDEYWLEAKKLLEKEEKKRRFIFWFFNGVLACAAIAIVVFALNFLQNDNNNKTLVSSQSSATKTNNNSDKNKYINDKQSNILNEALTKNSNNNSSNENLDHDAEKQNFQQEKNEGSTAINELLGDRKVVFDNIENSLISSKIEIDNKSNFLTFKDITKNDVVNAFAKLKSRFGDLSIYGGAQVYQAFYQNNTNAKRNLSGKFGVSTQHYIARNIYLNGGIEFNMYQNLYKHSTNDISNDQIQSYFMPNIMGGSGDPGNTSGPNTQILTSVVIDAFNTYTIAGTVYNATDVVSRKIEKSEECVYAGSIGIPISIGLKVKRFSFQAGVTQEYILYNKVLQSSMTYINSTALTKTDNYSSNNYTNMNRWLTFANIGIDYNISRHIKIGIEAKNLMNKNHHNTLQSSLLFKYSF